MTLTPTYTGQPVTFQYYTASPCSLNTYRGVVEKVENGVLTLRMNEGEATKLRSFNFDQIYEIHALYEGA